MFEPKEYSDRTILAVEKQIHRDMFEDANPTSPTDKPQAKDGGHFETVELEQKTTRDA